MLYFIAGAFAGWWLLKKFGSFDKLKVFIVLLLTHIYNQTFKK